MDSINLWAWFIAGFPSPWRWARRAYWRRKFNRIPKWAQALAILEGVDPQSLMLRGIL